jgi:hypothetical protein
VTPNEPKSLVIRMSRQNVSESSIEQKQVVRSLRLYNILRLAEPPPNLPLKNLAKARDLFGSTTAHLTMAMALYVDHCNHDSRRVTPETDAFARG